MAVVSSKTLFHYTSTLDAVKAILKSKGFWPMYCIEYGWSEDFYFAVPQCSFCDIPLSLIKSHVKKYGHFGIGMSKSWGIKKRPVPSHVSDNDFRLWKKIEKEIRENM